MTLSRTTREGNRSRWLALIVLCAGMLMIVLDATIVNVALPSIQRDLGFSQSSLAWVVNAYLIPFGGLLLLAGRLGDLIGRRRVFMTGLAVTSWPSARAPAWSRPPSWSPPRCSGLEPRCLRRRRGRVSPRPVKRPLSVRAGRLDLQVLV